MGLLDGIPKLDTPQGQGLLAAAFQLMGSRGSFGESIGRAGMTYMGATQQAQESAANNELRRLQVDGYKRKAEQEQAAMELAARQRKALQAMFARPGGATNQVNDALPADLRIGALPAMPQKQIDYQALLAEGVDPALVKALAESRNYGRDKVARTAEVEGPNGGKLIQGFDDYGQPVGQGVNGYVAPVSVNQGDRTSFVKPMAGISLPMGMSPADRDASARGWASNGLARERLNFDRAGGADALKPQYKDGQWVTPPQGMAPGQAVPAFPTTANKDANEALQLIKTAKEIIPKSTGSYLGAGVDQVARVFGSSTGGDTAAAQLKALEGALISKMPKMSGPQSDKDVLLYKQMAGEIGDPTIPQARKMAALQVIEQIQQRHAGASGSWDASDKPKKSGGWSIEKVQ